MLGNSSHCLGRRRDETPCMAQALLSSGYCFAHDPDNQANAARARAAGGRGRARARRAEKLMPATLRPVLQKLLDALDEVHDGTLSPRQGEVLACLAGAIVRVYEVSMLEERLAVLEQAQASAPATAGRRLA